jgi:putative spermidine/putrescine transport system substrate-binding protein
MRKSLLAVPILLSAALVASCSSSGTASDAASSLKSAAASAVAGAQSAAASVASAAAGAGSAAASAAGSAAAGGAVCGDTVDQIAAKAKEEGNVNLIALPDSWANYGGILKSFRDKYGLEAPVATPDASSADELTAIKTLAGQPDKPDAIDIGPSFVEQAKSEGAIEPYKTTNWSEIPDNLKDPDGNWVGAYYGIMSIGSNATLVKNPPKTWADLKKPEYKGQVTINGDPRQAGAAFAAVIAASLANGGSYDDIMPGIKYFADLKKAGNLQVIDVTPAALVSGDVPISLDWTYNFPGVVQQMKDAGFDLNVTIPTDGLYGSYYAQSVVKDAPHPCAGRLWLEHLTGNDGALGYLEGGAIPARYAALDAAGLITPDMKKNLPSADLISKITFPTAAQTEVMKKQLTDNWGPMVADA